jgi:sugar (pentulose or hexulose) kinase
MHFLVIDVGTSGCRATAVSDKGQILSQSRGPIKIDQQRVSFAEIDIDRLWLLIQQVVKSEVKKHPGIAFDALGVSGMLGYVFLDKSDQPLMPAITYADNRATVEAEKLQQLFPGEKFFAITGRKPSPLLLAPKIMWLAEQRPQTFKKLAHIIGLKDEIIRRLSGSIQTDVAHLDYSGLYNVYTAKLEPVLLDALNIKSDLFAAPAPATAIAGNLTAAAARQLGLSAGTPVISGSSDGTTAMYGAGVLDDEKAVLVSGTTDVLMMCCRSAPRKPDHSLSVNSAMLPGAYLVGGPLGLSGGSLQYFEQMLKTSAAKHEAKIKTLPPGSDGLLIFPGLTGERSPYWKEYLTGAIIGLTQSHKSEHILRAVMEGCALRILKLLNVLSQNRLQPRTINVVGGGANIDVWNQIRSDVTGREFHKLSITEATSLGTALFCMAALDKTRSLPEISGEWIKVASRYSPNRKHTRTYKKLARLFEKHIETDTNVYQGLNEFRR